MSLTVYGVTRGLGALLGLWLLPAWLGRRRGVPPRIWEITFLPVCAAFYLGAILAGHFLRFGGAEGLTRLWQGDVYLQGGEGVAGILAAKRTSDLIPLCHQLALTGVDVDFTVGKGVAPGVFVVADMSHPRISERIHKVVRDRLGGELLTPKGDMVAEEIG